ncbi:hypothetical protein LTR17_001800 [Elasticomyces elasticus]|nr:hypothetical protein LTR17_001800 [Elasticomyces elasticus]
MVLPKNYLSISQQLEEAYDIVKYQNQKLNILKDVVADFMDGLNVTALFAEYGDDKEGLEKIVLERASCRLTRRGETWKPWPPAEPVAQTALPPTGPVAETGLPDTTIVAQPDLPPIMPAAEPIALSTVLVAQPELPPTTAVAQTNLPLVAQRRRKHGKLLGPKTDSPHMKWTHKKSRTPPTRIIKIRKPPTVTSHQDGKLREVRLA